ncbi:uncharacterized protein BT62DRAFT_923880 [Guyanagaster necrorhizus]|uniref:Serine hydrolase domain-containing protein n=1 Tax=Guyanagaster necrorhizus TaxID=856835 RepID=A0A9P7VGQ8_9AGAR|nr:uncharacterized protein BT62DRAFT_923880 [Guyanagaster necrorhizus MCA 3950]KAG7440701.1 hypothetical protein BT62DRAFT_923880 [Guyanagaster necrorhizus MCA 3950]
MLSVISWAYYKAECQDDDSSTTTFYPYDEDHPDLTLDNGSASGNGSSTPVGLTAGGIAWYYVAENATIFSKRLGSLRKECSKDIELVFVDAPHAIQTADLRANASHTELRDFDPTDGQHRREKLEHIAVLKKPQSYPSFLIDNQLPHPSLQKFFWGYQKINIEEYDGGEMYDLKFLVESYQCFI